MNFEDFKNPEMQEKLKSASNPMELLELAKEAGFELADEQLETVSGGIDWDCLSDVGNCDTLSTGPGDWQDR